MATCTAMGAGKADKFDLTPLYGKQVIVVMDRDEAGSPARGPDHRPAGRPCRGVGCASQTGKDAADHVVSGNSSMTSCPSSGHPSGLPSPSSPTRSSA